MKQRTRGKNTRVAVAALALTMALAPLSACSGGGTAEKVFPTYETNHSFYVAGWGCPYVAEEDYRLAKEAGINHFLVTEDYSKQNVFLKQAELDLGTGAGITSVMHVGNSYNSVLEKPDTDYNVFAEHIDRVCYSDEPIYKDFDTLKSWAAEHDQKYGNQFAFYVNLLGATEKLTDFSDTEETQTFEHYLEEYCEKVLGEIKTGEKILSCDYYPITENVTYGIKSIKLNWLYSLEQTMYYAHKYGAKHEEMIQVAKHKNGSDNYPESTENSLRFQAYVLLNFETTGFTYFTYSSPDSSFSGSCVNLNKSQSLNAQYDYVKKINEELRAFENIYLNYKVDGVMPVYSSENEDESDKNPVMKMMKYSQKSLDGVSSVVASQDTLVSGMSDKDENKAMVITNFSNPYDGDSDEVTIQFDSSKKYTRLAVFRKGERKVYEIKDNQITLELEMGEGVFVMPA